MMLRRLGVVGLLLLVGALLSIRGSITGSAPGPERPAWAWSSPAMVKNIGLAVAAIAVVVGVILWRAGERRATTVRRMDQERDRPRIQRARAEQAERDRPQAEQQARHAQTELAANQAAFAFSRSDEDSPVGVGEWRGVRMLGGELQSIGMADALRVRMRAFLNDTEVPHLGSWLAEQPLPAGTFLTYQFMLPYMAESSGQTEGPRLDEALGNAVVRFDVRFNDASAADRSLSSCFRFDRAPLPKRWLARQVDC